MLDRRHCMRTSSTMNAMLKLVPAGEMELLTAVHSVFAAANVPANDATFESLVSVVNLHHPKRN